MKLILNENQKHIKVFNINYKLHSLKDASVICFKYGGTVKPVHFLNDSIAPELDALYWLHSSSLWN